MTAVNVTDTAAMIVANGNCNFIHIFNNSGATIYIAYDGSTATVAEGIPLLPNQTVQLNNDGSKPIFTRGVSAIHEVAGENMEVRIQQG